MSQEEQDREAFHVWLAKWDEIPHQDLIRAFRAGLEHARTQSLPMEPSHADKWRRADQWREAMTAELIALRTIVLRLGSAVWEERRAEVEELEREWHSVCLSKDANPRIAESKYKEAKASYEAVERAMVVLEAARNRDEKAQSDDARR